MKYRRKGDRVTFVIVVCMADKGESKKGDMRSQPVKGRKTQEKNANDLYRLRGVNLKIKFGHFQKITKPISMGNLFLNIPSGRKKRRRYDIGRTLFRNWPAHCGV